MELKHRWMSMTAAVLLSVLLLHTILPVCAAAEPVFAAAIFVPDANDPEVASWVDGRFVVAVTVAPLFLKVVDDEYGVRT